MSQPIRGASWRVQLVPAPFDALPDVSSVEAVALYGRDVDAHVAALVDAAPALPLIVLADVDARAAARLIAAGVDEVLPADAALPLLERAIEQAMARRQRAAKAAAHAASVAPQAIPQVEALTRLSGGVAHDFNNLLLVIAGQAERLRHLVPADAEFREPIDAIAGAATRAAGVTQQLLAISRRQMLVPDTLELSALVLESVGLVSARTGERVHIVTHMAHGLPAVHADRAQMQAVLANLASNAGEAMPQGGTLTLSTDLVDVSEDMRRQRPWLPPGCFVRLQVADTGRGIEQRVLPHVFEPFTGTADPTHPQGLGLTSVYSTIKQSGGYIWIDSMAGRGTQVTILLPCADAEATRVTGVPRALPAAVPVGQPRRRRVLLVEDEQEVRTLLTEYLEQHGMDVLAAGDAETALLRADEKPFDLLLTDVVLPGVSGPELARDIRQRYPGVRVLFMSGYTGDLCSPSDLDSPRGFLQKPFSMQTLLERVREFLAEPAAS